MDTVSGLVVAGTWDMDGLYGCWWLLHTYTLG